MNSAENVSVKPLEWKETGPGSAHMWASTPVGKYTINVYAGMRHAFQLNKNHGAAEYFDTEQEAKAAAHIDYEECVLSCLRSPPTEAADRVKAVGRYADAIKRMREALDLHDAEVADELASEGERADLWTDIEVLVEDLRTLLYASPRPKTVVSDARLGEAIYRAMYQHKGSDWGVNETKQVWTEIGARFRQFSAALSPQEGE